jgi:hypothetical protein
MRILDIDIYRDGGSISFRVERDEAASRIWLDTPFDGEPRALRIIPVPIRRGDPHREEAAAAVLAVEMKSVRTSMPIKRGDPAVGQLLTDIAEWWKMVPSDVQGNVRELMSRRGTYYVKPGEEAKEMQASELSHVIAVRDYVLQHYAG